MPVPDPASGVNKWSIDFFFVDQDGVPTFVECKRYNDSRARREVIGQMLEYAANAQYYWERNDLKTFAKQTATKRNENIDDLLRDLLGTDQDSADAFFEKVQNNLKEAQIRLIFFLDQAPFELRSIVDFLNRQMERTEVLIVEAKQFCHNEMKILVPSLFGFTEQARRIKKKVIIEDPKRRKWDQEGVLDYIKQYNIPQRFENIQVLTALAESNPALMSIAYGTGQSPTIIVRNNVSRAMYYIWANSGSVQLSATALCSDGIEFLKSLENKYKATLHWNAKFESGKYPSLKRSVDDMTQDEMKTLSEFILEMAEGIKDLIK